MAITVPRYDGPQVQATNLPGVRHSDGGISAETFGSGVAAGVADAGEVLFKLAQEQRQQADDAALMAFKNQMSAVESDLLYDPEKGAFARQGSQAFTAVDDTLPEWDRRQAEAIGNLPPRLQAQALNLADGMRTNARQGIMRHVLQQTEVYRDQQADGMVANATNAAVQHYLDPARLGEELATIEAGVAMKMRGAPVDAVAAAQGRARSLALAGVVERTIQDDPFAGDEALAKYRGELDVDHLLSLEAKLAPLKEAVELDGVAEAVMHGLPSSAVVPPQRGKPSPEMRSAIEAAAKETGVPAAILYAIAEQESSFNPRAVGVPTKGGERAQGPFQYLPSTAAELGIDPMNVKEAALATARQFAERSREHGFDYAIAAHFAGEGGAAAVVDRGRTKENPRTARYLAEVQGRYMRWSGQAGEAPVAAPPATLGEAIGLLRQDPRAENPLWRRKAEARVRSEWAVVEADRLDSQRVALERMRMAVVDAGATGASLSDVLSPEDLALAQQQGWDATLDEKLQKQRRGVLARTDPVVYDKFHRLMVRDPEAFASKATIMEIWQSEGSLATDDLERLQSAWVEVNTPDKAAGAQARTKMEGALVDRGLVKLGWFGEGFELQKANFRLAIAQARDAFRDTYGKEPTFQQDSEILSTVVQQFTTGERVEYRGRRSRSLSNYALTIPAEVREDARRRMRAELNIENPSEQQIVAYIAAQEEARNGSD